MILITDSDLDAEGCPVAKRSPGEGWPVGVLAHHVAVSYAPIAGAVRAVADGGALPPMSLADQAATNARHAAEHAHVAPAAVLDALRREGAEVTALVGGLRDEQFARTTTAFGGREMTVAQLVEHVVIGHPRQHLAGIRAALSA